jgi:hypothetical protein
MNRSARALLCVLAATALAGRASGLSLSDIGPRAHGSVGSGRAHHR